MSQIYSENPGAVEKVSHMRRDYKCAERAKERDQQTFTLVEQDRSSPRTIAFWILENIETCPAAKLHDALEAAVLMRSACNRKDAD